jgi:hypothetical protein
MRDDFKIETVEDAQHELAVACQEILADMGDDAPDEGDAMVDMWRSMSWNWPTLAAEVARREFGWVPNGGCTSARGVQTSRATVS